MNDVLYQQASIVVMNDVLYQQASIVVMNDVVSAGLQAMILVNFIPLSYLHTLPHSLYTNDIIIIIILQSSISWDYDIMT